MPIKVRTPAGWLDGSAWLFVLLAVLTLLPAAVVLWFTNDALARESAAARLRVTEAYRGQLRLVRSRLDPLWRAYAARLDGSGDPGQRFERLVADGVADGVVLLTGSGAVEYPDRRDGRGRAVVDIERQLAGAAALPADTRRRVLAGPAARLNDYTESMPATVRLMLMDRLRELAPNVWLPTQAALRLSIDLVEAERPLPAPEVMRQTAIPDVWALTSGSGRVIALYRTGRLEAMMHDFLHEVTPEGIRFVAFPPGVAGDEEAIAAGPWLPGWQLSFVPLDLAPFDADARRQRTAYVAVALAGVTVMAIIGVAVVGSLRRHLRLSRLKTDLVAAASHELRTPLASMRVLVDGLLADPELDPSKTREYLEMVAAENARLSRLVENFLTFSRLDRTHPQFACAPTRPANVVAAAVEAVRDRVPASCELRVEIAPDIPTLEADEAAVTTALVNLLDNALKYTPAEKRIVVRARPDGDERILFEVSDNGIGIAAGEQRRIFRRFYRVDQRLSRDTGGVGLGLGIVDLIVRGHGGTVSVRSEPGAGSTFTLRLPRHGQGVAA